MSKSATRIQPILMSRTNDFVFKRIFGDKRNTSVLIDFLNCVLDETIYSVELLNTELKREHLESKQGILDVKACTDAGTVIDIEIQLQNTKEMPRRTLFYWAKLYTEQLKPRESYKELKKTITINILSESCIPNTKTHNVFQLLERDTHYQLTDVIEIHFLELDKLPKKAEILESLVSSSIEATKEDTLAEWLIFLETDKKEVIEMLAKKNKEIGKAYSILEAMSKNKEARQLYEAREALLHDQATLLEEGIEKGIEIKALLIAKALKEEGMTDEKIAKLTGLSLEQIENLSKV